MLKRNRKHINSFKIGDLVLLKVDDLDRGSVDAANLLCVIMDVKKDLFKLGTKAGLLDGHFAFNDFDKTDIVTQFNKDDVPQIDLAVRSAVTALSLAHGQGVLKCNCAKGNCNSGKCKCFKTGRKCGSKCHKDPLIDCYIKATATD